MKCLVIITFHVIDTIVVIISSTFYTMKGIHKRSDICECTWAYNIFNEKMFNSRMAWKWKAETDSKG